MNQVWLTGKRFGVREVKVLASMLMMHVPLTTLDLTCKMSIS